MSTTEVDTVALEVDGREVVVPVLQILPIDAG